MDASEQPKGYGLLRQHAELTVEFDLGAARPWNWKPLVDVNFQNLQNISPSSEYNED